jgi:ankyrin repeat protein
MDRYSHQDSDAFRNFAVEVEARDESGLSPLCHAIPGFPTSASTAFADGRLSHACVDAVRFLLNNRANVAVLDDEGLTTLFLAIFADSDEIVKMLLVRGDNKRRGRRTSLSPLCDAIAKNATNAVKALVDGGRQRDCDREVPRRHSASTRQARTTAPR